MAAIADAIREGAEGFEVVTDPSRADRSVLVLPPDTGGFIAIYDEASESQDTVELDELAAQVSRAAQAHAFSVLVHDSDVLRLGLFRSGELRDTYDSYPGYFGDGPPRKKKSKTSKSTKTTKTRTPANTGVTSQVAQERADAWAPLLAAAHTRDELVAAFAAEDLFAEATLHRLAELFACDTSRVATGYRYVMHDGVALPEGTLTLHLRAKVRPAYETTNEGPPKLEVHMPYGEVRQALAVGDELRLSYAAKNTGGASRGVTFTVWGEALTKGLVEVERFEVLFGNVLAGATHTLHVPEVRTANDGQTLLVVDLPEAELVAGAMPAFGPGVDVRRAMDAWQRAMVHVNVVGRVRAAGEGALFGAIVPRENHEGAWAGSYGLAIDEPFARPLRAALDATMPGGTSHVLRPLAGTRYLAALLSIDAPRSEAVTFAREALVLLRDAFGEGHEVFTTIFRAEGGARPKSGKGKVKTLLFGKRLDGLVDAMVNESEIDVRVRESPAFDPETGPSPEVFGITFGTTALPNHEETRVPTLSLYLDTEAASVPLEHRAKVLEGLRAGLMAILERAMAGKGVQASLFRVGSPTSMGATAYEQACRMPHDLGTKRAFVTRYLRVPGSDTTWLGPSLAAHLGPTERQALASLGELTPCGDSLRITLADRARFGELEQALASLLPTFEEAHALARSLL